ncbi:MAG: alpha-hydroxy acid oxidase [Lysobacteraceae bacterium]
MSAPLPPLAQIPPQIAAVADYAAFARERMTAAAWAYFEGGAGDEQTLADNRAAFARLRLRNRVLVDLSQGDTRIDLFGDRFDYPILLAPVAHQRLAHPDGEQASLLAASAMRAGMVVSTESDTPLEDLARAARTPLWFQLYFQPDRAATAALLRRAEAAGCRALVLTVDAPVNGPRNREQRAGLARPPGQPGAAPPLLLHPGESLFDSALLKAAPTWADLDWLRRQTRLPLLLKGITAVEDALRAEAAGVDGIIVSNHGGRLLDSQIASIDALPEIAAALGGRLPILLDGGIRRGTDILKALALGACAVLVGRPCVHALASAGAPGVAHVLHLLRSELETAMALCGCPTLAAIDRRILIRRDQSAG